MMFAVIGMVFCIGAVMTLIGLRGRRTDDHPLCRRCRFDLTGRAPGSTRCPECGAELERSGATIVGHRRTRTGTLAVGLSLLTPITLLAAALGWGRVHHVDWVHRAPFWYVVRQLSPVSSDRHAAAMRELLARANTRNISAHQWATLADLAAQCRGDDSLWDPGWADLVGQARAQGQLADGQWSRYWTQLIRRASAAPPAREGFPWPVASIRRQAMSELIARLHDGQSTSLERAAVVDAALAYQGDTSKLWDAAWGTLLEESRSAGHLSDGQWQMYARQAVSPATMNLMVATTPIRDGEPVSITLNCYWPRAAANTALLVEWDDWQLTWADGTVIGSPSDTARGPEINGLMQPRQQYRRLAAIRLPLGMTNGPHDICLAAVARVGSLAGPGRLVPFATFVVNLTTTATVAGQGETK